MEYDKSPISSRRSSSSHYVQEETRGSPRGAGASSSSGGEISRRGSQKKMELISMEAMPILNGPAEVPVVQENEEQKHDEPTTSRGVKSTDL